MIHKLEFACVIFLYFLKLYIQGDMTQLGVESVS